MTSRRTKYGFLLLFALIIALTIYGVFLRNPSGAANLLPPDTFITAPALTDSFDKNEGHADSLYLYKALSVSGILERLHKNAAGRYVATLTGLEKGRTAVDCILDSLYSNKQIPVNAGDSITIRGRCSGRSLNVILVQCIIEK